MTFEEASYFAQTWGLVLMVVLFAGVLVYALRPGSRKKFEEAANIPLEED